MPKAQHTTETTGKSEATHVFRISRRSCGVISSGSPKISMLSKPMSFVNWMPRAVSTEVPSHAELISPSFKGNSSSISWELTLSEAGEHNIINVHELAAFQFISGGFA